MQPSNATDLAGRVALVTGASSGIGAAVARRLAGAGVRVAALARRADRLAALAAVPGVLAVPADVGDHAALSAAVERARAELGPIDLVVAAAGILVVDPLLDAEPARIGEIVSTNVTGAVWAARGCRADLAAAAAAGRAADVVLVSSPSASTPYPLMALYGTTKAAVRHFAGHLRAELAPAGVRVHDVEPGWTATELTDDYAAGVAALPPETAALAATPPPGVAPMTPDDVAGAVLYCLCAPPGITVSHLALSPTGLP